MFTYVINLPHVSTSITPALSYYMCGMGTYTPGKTSECSGLCTRIS